VMCRSVLLFMLMVDFTYRLGGYPHYALYF